MYKWVFSERLKLSGDEHHRIASVRVFQARGPATAKVRSPSVECRIAGTVKSAEEAERRRRRGLIFLTGWMTACRYLGADPCTQLKTSTQSLYWMCWGIRNQCRSASNGMIDVVVKLCPDCETCGGINDRLQSVQFTAWRSGKGDVAIIQFGHNQTGDECQHGLPWQWAANAADLPQTAEARADESRDVWLHRRVTIQVDT